jgi:hypothetical protein
MIQMQQSAAQTIPTPALETNLQGGQGLDIERFAGALAMLESYVDGMLAANELPAMDPWVEDEVTDARLASL